MVHDSEIKKIEHRITCVGHCCDKHDLDVDKAKKELKDFMDNFLKSYVEGSHRQVLLV